jgi:hypothetical protein
MKSESDLTAGFFIGRELPDSYNINDKNKFGYEGKYQAEDMSKHPAGHIGEIRL